MSQLYSIVGKFVKIDASHADYYFKKNGVPSQIDYSKPAVCLEDAHSDKEETAVVAIGGWMFTLPRIYLSEWKPTS